MQSRNIALLAVCQAVMMTGTTVLLATSALVGRTLADNTTLATIPLGLQFMAMAVGTVPASLLMEQYGRRAGFMLGILIGICGAILATYAMLTEHFLLFCASAILLGFFNGSGQFYRFAAADVAEPSRKTKAISLVLAGGIVAAFLGPNLANWSRTLLATEFAGSYLMIGAVYLVGVIAIAMLRIPLPPKNTRATSGRALGLIARQPRFLVAVLAATVGYGAMNLLMVSTPLSMLDNHHGFADAAFVLQWHVVAMFLPSFFTGDLIRRFGLLSIIATGVLLMIACVFINWTGTGVWHYWAALICLGTGWNFLFIGGTTMLTDTYAEAEKAKAQACNDFVVFGTVTVTALSSGAMLQGVGWTTMNLSVLPFLLLVLAGLGWVVVNERNHATAV